MTLVLILAAALMVLMALVEWANYRRTRRLTFLTAAHGLIAVGYCLPPFLIAFLPGTSWQYGPRGPAFNPWGMRLFALDLADHLALSAGAYVTVGIVLLGAYAALLTGYALGGRLPMRSLGKTDAGVRPLATGGTLLLVVAAAAIAVYSSQFRDLGNMLDDGVHVRTGNIAVRWGYLQVLAQIAFPAALILAAAGLQGRGWIRPLMFVLAAGAFAIAMLRGLHVSGRLELGTLVFVPVLATMFLMRSRGVAVTVLIVIAFTALIVIGMPHDYARRPLVHALDIAAHLPERLSHYVVYAVSEFAFPYITAAHALTLVPDAIGFRYFIDIPLGALYMLPNFSGVETLPPMILSLQAKLLPWMPVDLFSFGYYSLGTVGVLIIFAGFGAVLAVFDSWLTGSSGWLGQALRAAWLFYLPFRLFYADPYAAAYSGFGLITATLLIVLLIALSRRRA